MTKIRKQKRKKTYRYNVNRRRIKRRKNQIECIEVKKAWDTSKSVEKNMSEMNLVYDINKSLKIPTTKELRQPKVKKSKKVDETDMETDEPPKAHVAKELENDARAPRVRMLRLPKNQVQWLSYLILKYEENYKAMARDPKNYNQDTWKQIRAKIKTFKGIPEQYEEFLKSSQPEIKTEDQE